MEYGIQLATSAHHWKVVKRAEELGFTHAWFYDTHLLNAEIFVAMGAAAVTTSRSSLGTGVLIPSNRIAPVAASALASLNALAPGRIDFGISTGFTGRRTMGVGPITLARLEDMHLCVVAGAAAHRRRDRRMGSRTAAHKIRFLNPDIGYINIAIRSRCTSRPSARAPGRSPPSSAPVGSRAAATAEPRRRRIEAMKQVLARGGPRPDGR